MSNIGFARESRALNLNMIRDIILITFIALLFLQTACTHRCDSPARFSDSLTVNEREHLQQFFQFLLFKNYGAYVLFGSKPLCELSIRDMDSQAADIAFKQFWAELPPGERETIEALRNKIQSKKTQEELDREADLENSYYRGWLVFQKIREGFKLKDFLFRVLPNCRPDAYDLLFINIPQTAFVLEENYEIFKKASGMDFDPLLVVFEAEDPDSRFWKNVMSMENHLAKGLLFGFGLKNSLVGSQALSGKKREPASSNEEFKREGDEFVQQISSLTSIDVVPQGSSSLNIPLFSVLPGDETAEKYAKERTSIEQKYRNQDLIEVTFKRLLPMQASIE